MARAALDRAERHRHALARHQVLEGVEHRQLDELHIRIKGAHQRQLLLEHQGADRPGAEDGVALAGLAHQHRDVGVLVLLDPVQVTELELGHAAAGPFSTSTQGTRLCSRTFRRSCPMPGSL